MKRIKIYLIVAILMVVNVAFAEPTSTPASTTSTPISTTTSTTTTSAPVSQSFSMPLAESSVEGALTHLTIDELWNQANTDYANSNYIGAERAYNEILNRDVHSAALYYNIGNVHHKRDELALSLLNYYKALRLAPSDVDILHNIEVVKAKTTDHIESMPRLFIVEWSEWLGSRLSCMEWSILSLLFFALAMGVLLIYFLSESLRFKRIGFFGVVLFGLMFVVATRYAIVERSEILNSSEAIVMSRSMSVKSSPNRASTELFILHEGTKVEILTTHDSWSEIKIEDGKRGWVESSRIEQI